MITCPNCNTQLPDGSVFCQNCGASLAQQGAAPVYAPPVQPVYTDPTDHTAEFTAEDVSANKVYAMALYLLGTVGLIICLLARKDSKYLEFHSRQAMKLIVLDALLSVAMAVLAFTVIVPLAASVCMVILLVVKIICFFNVAANKSKEPPIVKNLSFLN